MGCVASTVDNGPTATRRIRVAEKYTPEAKKTCSVCGGKGLFCIGTGERHAFDDEESEKLEQDRVYLMGIYDSHSLLQSLVYYLRHGTSLTNSDGAEQVLKLRHKDHTLYANNAAATYPNLAKTPPEDLVLVVITADDSGGLVEDASTPPIPLSTIAKIVLGSQDDAVRQEHRVASGSRAGSRGSFYSARGGGGGAGGGGGDDAPAGAGGAGASTVHRSPPRTNDSSSSLTNRSLCRAGSVHRQRSRQSAHSLASFYSESTAAAPYLFHHGTSDIDAMSTVHTFSVYVRVPGAGEGCGRAQGTGDVGASSSSSPPPPPPASRSSDGVGVGSSAQGTTGRPPPHPAAVGSPQTHCPLEGVCRTGVDSAEGRGEEREPRRRRTKLKKLTFRTRMIHDLEAWVIALSSLTKVAPSWRRAIDLSTYEGVYELDDIERVACSQHNITPMLYTRVKEYLEHKKISVKRAESAKEARRIAYGIGTPTFRSTDAALKVTKGELRFWTGCDIFRTSVIWSLLARKNIIYDSSPQSPKVPITLYTLWYWSQAVHAQGSWLLRRTIRTVMLIQRCPRDVAGERKMLPDELLAIVFSYLPLFP